MNVQLLIDSIVRQVTVLIAQLATSGGIRAPVAHIANQVFVDLANELAAQGISRKVSADMFGMALRAYVRKVRRLEEGQTDAGKTLWQALLGFIQTETLVTRARVLDRFKHDEELQVTALLHDIVESGLVFSSGSGQHTVYRAASDDEIGELSRLSAAPAFVELLWVLIYREGPLSIDKLAARVTRAAPTLKQGVEELILAGRVQRTPDGSLSAQDFTIPLGAPHGWEAAVLDHVQAVVQTICQRLQAESAPERADLVGGSTYSMDVWAGHPLEARVRSQLEELRERCGALREEVSAYNQAHALPEHHEQVITYVGQCLLEREPAGSDDALHSPNDRATQEGSQL